MHGKRAIKLENKKCFCLIKTDTYIPLCQVVLFQNINRTVIEGRAH